MSVDENLRSIWSCSSISLLLVVQIQFSQSPDTPLWEICAFSQLRPSGFPTRPRVRDPSVFVLRDCQCWGHTQLWEESLLFSRAFVPSGSSSSIAFVIPLATMNNAPISLLKISCFMEPGWIISKLIHQSYSPINEPIICVSKMSLVYKKRFAPMTE